MKIKNEKELLGMKEISNIVAEVLFQMKNYAKPGISTKDLDNYGGKLLKKMGAVSAPKKVYNFPGFTCICVNEEIAHGIPSPGKIIKDGDLINIDVSAEKHGFYSDNGGSFVLGVDKNNIQPLVEASKHILFQAIKKIKSGVKISDIGKFIESEANLFGYKVIKNLAGHGVGRSLHEEPKDILCCEQNSNKNVFEKNSVIAIETFISDKSTFASTNFDGWTLIGDKSGLVAQHEHTIIVTDKKPIILTLKNKIKEF